MNHLSLFICLSAGGFIYQWLAGGDYLVAFERSFFMGFAIAACRLFARDSA